VKGDELLMTAKDRKRLYIIRQAVERKITQKKAGELLHLCRRQVKRLCRRVRTEGDVGILHKSRGRFSNRRIDETLKQKILQLAEKR
jgi:hypothetical protein